MTLAFLLRVRQYAAFGLHPNITQLLEKSRFFSFQICCLIIPGHMLINILVLIINFYMKISNDRYRYFISIVRTLEKSNFWKGRWNRTRKYKLAKVFPTTRFFFKFSAHREFHRFLSPLIILKMFNLTSKMFVFVKCRDETACFLLHALTF